jgi:acyl transferase domain-containing protein/NAD(P)H-dependent flavin oxidoreductase YrpB (nitropropane dioxygenase family)/NAD(P)-dependent dehydrogenase (short-subunit alcohol dehydrogenase family)
MPVFLEIRRAGGPRNVPLTSRPDLDFIVLSPPGGPDVRLPVAASRAGAIGVLDLQFAGDPAAAHSALAELARLGKGRFGVLVAGDEPVLDELVDRPGHRPDAILLAGTAPDRLRGLVALSRSIGARAYLIATDLEQAMAGEAAGVDAVIAKGHEAAGWVGEESTFVLLQRLRAQLRIPVWAQGGVGLHSAAACQVAGAEGVVLDAQVLLARETPLAEAVKARIEGLDGSETACLGTELGAPVRVHVSPGLAPVAALIQAERRLLRESRDGADRADAWRDVVRSAVDWRRLDASVLAVGQDACFAADLGRRFRTVAGILDGLRTAAAEQRRSAFASNPMAEGSSLAVSHGTRYPIVQGPMTRVSDRPEFAAAVAEGGGLPFLALALMRGPEVSAVLEETKRLIGDRPWGAGILGFVPPELRAEQLEAIREHRPPFALIAGGRPAQARELEEDGIRTYLHVPSPGLLALYLRQGARRFVFEGRECGGHVGPRTSLVLWDTMVRTLLEELGSAREAADVHVLLAGGIHDGVSAAMAASVAAPLADRGMRVGALVGTGYLFTHEAVASGAIAPGFQEAALGCDRTVLLETGPGHAARCASSPFAQEFGAEKLRLRQADRPAQETRMALEGLNLGRLRIAAKGADRNPAHGQDPHAPKLVAVEPADQWRRGMYMIGQVAALRDDVRSVADLHRQLADGSWACLAAGDAGAVVEVRDPQPPPADIAIVGMSCILPGAPDLETFWGNVVDKVDAVGEVPRDRFDWREYFEDDRGARDKVYSRSGGFIPDVPFDPVAFGMTPNSLRSIEPFQLLGLLTAQSALADAGYAERPFRRDRTSVLLGAGGGGAALGVGYTVRSSLPMLLGDGAAEVVEALEDALPEWTEDSFPGILMNVAAGRIANRLDLGGANYTVDAACASGLAAISLAAQDLRSGRSDMAIAGGVDAIQTPFAYLCFAKTQALSPSGRCRPFDAEADGIAISEGFGAVVLKRLEDAERDGDRVYAVIRGIGAGSDGRDRSLTAPRPEGQMRALERAYAHAGFSPSTVGLVEAHGTGTVAGDGAEVKALSAVFDSAGAAAGSCAIGSVKSMIGHTKATAGVAGLIKAALALHHRTLPPTIGVAAPNPKAGFGTNPFYVNTETRPWVQGVQDHPRRASVSAFGFGGTNFHLALEEHDDGFLGETATGIHRWPAELLVWRGGSRAEIDASVGRLLARLEEGAAPRLADLARTLAVEADTVVPGGPNLAVVARSRDGLVEQLRASQELLAGTAEREHGTAGVHFADRPLAGPGAIAFLFPGQGSQTVDMARDVAVVFPEVRAAFERADRALAGRLERPLSDYVFPPPPFGADEAARRQAELTATDIAQPALGATGLAYLELLQAMGVRPAMTAGHSYGELLALAAAGSLTEPDLLRLSEARGRFMREETAAESGGMVAVGAPPEELEELLGDELVVANLNAPRQTVLSGSRAAVERAVEWCRARGTPAQALPVACAFHSPYVARAKQSFAAELARTAIAAPRLPVFSNTSAARYPEDPHAVAEVLGEHLVRPVDFVHEISAMHDAGARVFVEVGPRNVLSGLVGRILGDRPHVCAPVDRPGQPGLVSLLECLAAVTAEGAAVDLLRLFRGRSARRIALDALDGDEAGAPSPSTWLVNGAHAWPAASPRPSVSPIRVAVVRDGEPDPHPTQPRQGPVPVTLTSTNGHAAIVPPQAELPAALPGPGPPPDGARDVMTAYHQVMERFLDTQRGVMLAYLGQGRAPAPAPSAPLAAPPRAEPRLAPPVVEPSPAPSTPSTAPAAPAPAPAVAAPAANGHLTREDVTARLLAVVSERTGYPSDMLDLDADLEADLSIDSIKRVEIAGTIVESLPVTGDKVIDPERMTAARSLREVVDVLESILDGAEAGDGRPFVREPADERIGRLVLGVLDAPAAPGDGALAVAGAVVIAGDGTGVGAALEQRLTALGHDVVRVGAREAAAPGAASALAERVTRTQGGAKALVHLGALDDVAGAGTSLSTAHLDGLFALAKGLRLDLDDAAGRGGAVVVGATRMGGAFAVEGPAPVWAPAHGMVAGFLKTLAHEWPAVRVKAVDLDDAEPAAAAAALLREMTAADGLVEVGYRDGVRTRLELVPEPVGERPQTPPLDADGVLLVTGGARGITAEAALALGRRYGPTVVLVGRTPLAPGDPAYDGIEDPRALKQAVLERMRSDGATVTPAQVEAEHGRLLREREVRDTLGRFEAARVRVELRTCDVRDAEAFGAVVDDVYARHGRIDGVIHGAGAIEDKLVADKDPASLHRVVSTKVTGAGVLAARLRPGSLRFLVLFSSVSGRFGNRGQADYAAASEALNKLAQVLDRRWPARVVAIGWGPWLHGGMVSAGVRRQFAERGVELIGVETGCRRLDEELRGGRKGEAEVVVGGAAEPAPAALLSVHGTVERGSGAGATATRRLDVRHDLYLGDHRLDGRPVLPFAIATELMAEVAAAAVPGGRVAALEDIRLLAGIVVDDGGAAVRVTARPGEDGALDVSVTAGDEPGRERYASRAVLRAAAAAAPASLGELAPFPMTVADAYRELLFHGPLFQNILAIEGMDHRGARAVVRATAPEDCVAGASGAWWLDPVTMDCALQLQVIWARIHWGVTLLPARIGAVRPFAPVHGDALSLELHVRPSSRAPLCHADHVLRDASGQVLAVLDDVVGTGSEALNRLSGARAATEAVAR